MEAGAWWDFRRNTVAVRIMTEVAAEHGLAPSEALAGTRIAPSDLDDAGVEIDARQELAVVRNVVAALGDRPGLAAEVGSRFALGNYGLLGFAVLSSPTLRAALVVGLRYLALSYAFIRVSLEETGEQARIVVDDREIPPDVRRFLLERDFAALAGFIPSLVGPRLERYAAAHRSNSSSKRPRRWAELPRSPRSASAINVRLWCSPAHFLKSGCRRQTNAPRASARNNAPTSCGAGRITADSPGRSAPACCATRVKCLRWRRWRRNCTSTRAPCAAG